MVALVTIAKIWKEPKCPSLVAWIKEKLNTCTMEYDSAMRKKEILPLATAWMDLESIVIVSEISQKRQIQHGITYMWNLK